MRYPHFTLLLTLALFIGCKQQTMAQSSNAAAAVQNASVISSVSSCNVAADKWFKANYPLPAEETKAGSGRATYAAHFRTADGRCFLEAVATAHIEKSVDGAGSVGDSEVHKLIDVSNGQETGQFVLMPTSSAPMMCEVGGIKCSTMQGWEALIAPYMKD